MATHFLTDLSQVACGKNTSTDYSAQTDKVTCKNCLRSQAFTQRDVVAQSVETQAPAVVAAQEPVKAVKPALSVVMPAGSGKAASKPKSKVVAKATKGVAFAEWRERFGEKDRLPRGKAFASM
jgi:hypothetical protein